MRNNSNMKAQSNLMSRQLKFPNKKETFFQTLPFSKKTDTKIVNRITLRKMTFIIIITTTMKLLLLIANIMMMIIMMTTKVIIITTTIKIQVKRIISLKNTKRLLKKIFKPLTD